MKGASKIQAKQILNLDWLNTIPSGWSLTKLKSIYTPKKEYSDKEEELLSVYRDFGVIPKSSRDDNFNRASEDLSKYILIQPDDLVINKMKAWQGSIAISKYRGIVSPAYFTYKPNIDTKTKFFLPYLHHLLRSPLFVEVYKRISNGIRPQQWDLDPYLFSTLPIPMPPIDTQKRIAEYLDKKSIAIEKMINEKRRLIELLHEKKASFVNKVVIKGINSEQKYKDSGIDWLGEIPSSWEIKPFISLFKEKRNINYDGSIKNVLSLSYGKIIDRDVESNFGLLPASFNTYQIVEPGWIVFRLTDLQNDKKSLRTAIVLNKGIITSAYLAVEANKEIYPAYAAFLLYAYDLRKIFYSMGGGVRQSIGYAELKWLPIVMPHYDTQIKIADLLSKEVKKIDSAIQKTEEQISKLKEYHSSLIYATVTGKIKV